MIKRVSQRLIGVCAPIIFLTSSLIIAFYPMQVEAQSRTRRRVSRPTTASSPSSPARPPVEPEELTVENVRAILPRLRTCLTHDSPTQSMDVEDGQYPSTIMFYDNIDKYKYLEKRGWIRTQAVNRMIYIFFTPEAERLFFSGNPPEWASVEIPSEEARQRGYNRRRLKVTFARLELMRIIEVTPGITPNMNRAYTITALWRWKPTGAGGDVGRPRIFRVLFHVQRINGLWELMGGTGQGCSDEAPFYGTLPDSALSIEPSTITLDKSANQNGTFSVFFNNHNLAASHETPKLRLPCRLEDPSIGQAHKRENWAYIYPSLETGKRGGETTLTCEFEGLVATARVVIAPPPPPSPLVVEPAIIEIPVGQTVSYLVLRDGKNIEGVFTEGGWFLRCSVADRGIARIEKRRDQGALTGLRVGETTLTCIDRGANHTLPSRTGTARIIVR